ncbi:hypothetical protein CHUAL_010341 [Chamberlinius hualienensis]
MMELPYHFCLVLTLGMVISVGFLLTPLYIRYNIYGKYQIQVGSTETIFLDHQISTVWCKSEKISINKSFNAYLINELPHFENITRTYWTTKHYNLGSEEREYVGFQMPNGSSMSISLCSHYHGAKVMIFKGKRNMKKCVRHDVNTKKTDDKFEVSEEDNDYLTGNDLDEVDDDDNSSVSQEENLKECRDYSLVENVAPSVRCNNSKHWESTTVISYKITSTDYYYALVTSLNNLYRNTIVSNITLIKPIYNVTKPIDICQNVTECTMQFSFASSEAVVLEMSNEDDWHTDVAEIECQPRAIMYFPFYLSIPIIILCLSFKNTYGAKDWKVIIMILQFYKRCATRITTADVAGSAPVVTLASTL